MRHEILGKMFISPIPTLHWCFTVVFTPYKNNDPYVLFERTSNKYTYASNVILKENKLQKNVGLKQISLKCNSLRKNSRYLEFFWSVFSAFRLNTDQKNSEYGRFSRNDY